MVLAFIGFHRSLGPTISKVRSISLDKWKEEWIENLVFIGNFRANQYFEKNLNIKEKPSYDSSPEQKKKFIEEKYKHRNFIDLKDLNPFEEIGKSRRNRNLEKPMITSLESLKKLLKRKENPIYEKKKELNSEIFGLKINGKRIKVNKIEYEKNEDNKLAKIYDTNKKKLNHDINEKADNAGNYIIDLDQNLEENQFQRLSKQMRDKLLKGNPLELLEKIEDLGNIESLI